MAETTQLTDRERQVLILIAEGQTAKKAAAMLLCSKRTVDFHIHNILTKLCAENRIQAINRARERGLLP